LQKDATFAPISSNSKKQFQMKKLFAILAVAGLLTACGEGAATEETKTDTSATTTTTPDTSATVTPDTSAVKADTSKVATDTTKK
jgi:uncharacterized lipoprotein